MTRRQPYNLAAIRGPLTEAFTAEGLYRFCYDRPTFRPVTASFGPGQGPDDMVHELIKYCGTRFLWEELRTEVAKENPNQVARFEPCLRTRAGQCGSDTRDE